MAGILVTGGAGFIGSCLVRQWVREEAEPLVNLDKLTYAGNLDSVAEVAESPRYAFRRGDIADEGLVAELLARHRPSRVVNLAAETHVDRSIDSPAPFVETNVAGTFHLLEAVRRHWRALPAGEAAAFRFLHVSTDEVYGSLGSAGRFTEDTPYAPRSPYAASKAAADHLVRAYHETYGLPTLVTNCSNNYGPFQFPEKLIPLVALNALEGRPLPVYGDGGNVRDWLHVEDHCRALRLVLARGRPGATYNVGGDGERTNLEIVRAVCRAADRLDPAGAPHERLITFVADRPGHDRRYAIDATRIRTELGWAPRVALAEGIEATVAWYRESRGWLGRLHADARARGRLGLGAAGAG